jgi:methionine-R-sulfoxide reductase
MKYLLLIGLAVCFGIAFTTVNAKDLKEMKDTTSTGLDASHLSEKEKYITLHDGTEPPFQNEYWDHKEPGIYVDKISGEPLFSSTDKFDSGTGWPSFTKPIDDNVLQYLTDDSLGMKRTEVRSSKADAHLGHLFNDGPKEAGGKRFCMNSASLRFIHKDDLEKEGYKEYLYLFDEE